MPEEEAALLLRDIIKPFIITFYFLLRDIIKLFVTTCRFAYAVSLLEAFKKVSGKSLQKKGL